jgi:hypothetical protein
MSTADPDVSHPPASQRNVRSPRQSLFTVLGGPLAWFVQLNADFALASNPCFFDNERSVVPHLSYDWTWRTMIVIAAAAIAVALAATLAALQARRLASKESRDGEVHEIGAGRIRFLALWGICLGAGSALLIVLTALAFFMLPPCAG